MDQDTNCEMDCLPKDLRENEIKKNEKQTNNYNGEV